MPAVADEPLRRFEVRLFDEGLDRGSAIAGLVDLDVAIAGVRSLRHDTERHEHPVAGGRGGLADGRVQDFRVRNDVIGRQHEQ